MNIYLTHFSANSMKTNNKSFVGKCKQSHEFYPTEYNNTLVIVKELDENLILASRNIPNILLIDASELNVLDLVAATKVLVTKEALNDIEEVLK